MINFTFNQNEYTNRTFKPIPAGNHRVRICEVTEKTYSTGNEGFEIKLDVYGYNSKLWYHLVLDPHNQIKTNQRIGMFFDSFNIKDYNLENYNNWIGKDGAVRVNHNLYQGKICAHVAYCISRCVQDNLPKWDNNNNTETTSCQEQPNESSQKINYNNIDPSQLIF